MRARRGRRGREEARVTTTPKALTRRFAGMSPARLVLEVGTHSHWMSRLLDDCGHEVIIANPRMLRFIYRNDSKSDRADATYLARVGRLDPSLLSPVVHRSETRQADLALLRSREALVRTRANLVNHVRGMVKVFGTRLPLCSTDAFAKKVQDKLPEALRAALGPVVEIISAPTAQIQGLERKIETLARESYPETALLAQVPGVGTLTSLAFVLTVEDPGRFPKCRSVGSYLGLRPRQADSGALKPQLRITKAGDEMLRGPAGRVRPPYPGAVVAMARKLSVLLLRPWTTGEIYEPLRNAKKRGEPLLTPA